ncbi:MAG: cation diffusion facilitator family transporter [Vicinamibacterales bacterium]
MASSKPMVIAAILGNLAVAVTKFIAAGMTGSSAMLTEGLHSVSDTGNGVLLLVGLRVSRRPPDTQHPFGHGKELYFYTLLVAMLVFGVGGGISIYEGILHVLRPEPMTHVVANYVVIALAAGFEGASWAVALKGFRRVQAGRSAWQTVRSSKDPTTFAVLFEDSAALIGLAVAAAGIFLADHLRMPVLDGAASIVIGVLLCAVATVLLRETKALLVGEAASPRVIRDVLEAAAADPAVDEIGRVMTMHLGPEEILLNLDVAFEPDLSSAELATAVRRLERAIRRAEPRVRHIFIEAGGAGAGTGNSRDEAGDGPAP